MISNTDKSGAGTAYWMVIDNEGRILVSEPRNKRIVNQTLTSANTEYTVTLASGVRRVLVQGRHASGLVKMKFGASGNEYWMFNGNPVTIEGQFQYPTFVFESPAAGTVVDIIEFAS